MCIFIPTLFRSSKRLRVLKVSKGSCGCTHSPRVTGGAEAGERERKQEEEDGEEGESDGGSGGRRVVSEIRGEVWVRLLISLMTGA